MRHRIVNKTPCKRSLPFIVPPFCPLNINWLNMESPQNCQITQMISATSTCKRKCLNISMGHYNIQMTTIILFFFYQEIRFPASNFGNGSLYRSPLKYYTWSPTRIQTRDVCLPHIQRCIPFVVEPELWGAWGRLCLNFVDLSLECIITQGIIGWITGSKTSVYCHEPIEPNIDQAPPSFISQQLKVTVSLPTK